MLTSPSIMGSSWFLLTLWSVLTFPQTMDLYCSTLCTHMKGALFSFADFIRTFDVILAELVTVMLILLTCNYETWCRRLLGRIPKLEP